MPYEIFERKTRRTSDPSITIDSHGRFVFNKSATEVLRRDAVERILILWDQESQKVAVRPLTRKDPRSYRISYSTKGNGSSFSAKTFLDHIEYDYSESYSFPWKEADGMFEIEMPTEKLKGQKLLDIQTSARTATTNRRG